MSKNKVSFIKTQSTNLVEKVAVQGSGETYVFSESCEIQADDYTEEDQEQAINIPVLEISNQTNTTDCDLIRDMMEKYSIEDSLVPFEKEAIISQFVANNNDGNTCGGTTIKKILERIKNGAVSNKIGIGLAVTWAGRFKDIRKPNKIKEYSGLTAIEFDLISSANLSQFWSLLEKDPFTCILTADEITKSLTVIVKISANSVQEYSLAYQQLVDYYSSYYGITENELLFTNADICRLYDLKADLKVYYNPLSRRLNRLLANFLNQEKVGENPISIKVQQPYFENTSTDRLNQLDTTVGNIETKQHKSNTSLLDSMTAILETERRILNAANQEIVFKPALMSRLGVPIIRNGTINVIQGKQGQHKSRFAEMIASLLIAKGNCTTDFLGFERLTQSIMVCYLDTERNIDEECANSLQSIRRNAGYDFGEAVPNLRYISLKQEKRSQRLETIDQFLEQARQSTNLPLFVILDVVTDCVGSFNNDRDAMNLFDSIHRLCERHQATFLLIIHENPGSEKARGHVGTEATYKASMGIQISVEESDDTNTFIKLRYLKLRGDQLPDPIYLQINNQTKQLILADNTLLEAHVKSARQKIDPESLAESVTQLLAEGALSKGELCQKIMQQFGASDSLVRQKLTGLMKGRAMMTDHNGQQVVLVESTNGRQYFLQSIE